MQNNAFDKWIASQEQPPDSIKIYEDFGISGAKRDRPGFNQMLEACIAGDHDTIVVYKLDRFSRDANTAIGIILEMERHNVAFISVSQSALNLGHDVPFRRTILAAFSEIAQIERETIVERIREGLAAAKKRGIKLGRPDKKSPELAAKAQQLRLKGSTYKAIAKELKISQGLAWQLINDKN
jgi:DNA invertase Pin-like site-specific DNA recombinase